MSQLPASGSVLTPNGSSAFVQAQMPVDPSGNYAGSGASGVDSTGAALPVNFDNYSQYVVRDGAGNITEDHRTNGTITVVADAISIAGETIHYRRYTLRKADGTFLGQAKWVKTL